LKLSTYAILDDGSKKLLNSKDFDYVVFHHASHVINDPSQIISVSPEGIAVYKNEGYVSVKAQLKDKSLESEEILLATGKVYGDVNVDNVLAIFPENYSPANGNYTFGSMIKNYSNYIPFVNLAYNVESQLYGGFRPFGGDKQIFALLDIPNSCGGNMNPLETTPGCYMNKDSGEPQYDLVIHEMGHNFAYSKGMDQLLAASNRKINNAGFGECVASLPVQYLRAKILENPEEFDLSKNSYEYNFWAFFQNKDNLWNKERLARFESYISDGSTRGIFNFDSLNSEKKDSLQGNVGAFCTFFVTPAAYPVEFGNIYGWEFYTRFLGLFGNLDLENFNEDKVETYFSAAYSAAIGKDMRSRLRTWGFTIDNSYFEEIYPILKLKADKIFNSSDKSSITVTGDYSGFYDFPASFFENSSLIPEEVVKVTDAQYLALKDMHNGIVPYTFERIQYEESAYGYTLSDGLKLGKYASPSFNNGHHSWDVMAHEQGHNFFGGTSSFYYALATPYPFLQESLAVLSASYAENYILENNLSLGISARALADIIFVFNEEDSYQEGRYNNYTLAGSKFNISDTLTSQALDWKMIQYGKLYGFENYKKLSKIFESENTNKFTFQNDGVSAEEQSTFIVAILGYSFNKDFRTDFKKLNFPINDSLYNQVLESFHNI
jgi:hypothetical protein